MLMTIGSDFEQFQLFYPKYYTFLLHSSEKKKKKTPVVNSLCFLSSTFACVNIDLVKEMVACLASNVFRFVVHT